MTALPVSRVFGSKGRLARQLAALIPGDTTIYVEPFAGSASVLLAKRPHPSEHLNDLDGDVVNLFRVLRSPLDRDRLIELIDFTPWSEAEFRAERAAFKDGALRADAVDRAWAYLVRSWMGVAGDVAKPTGFKFDTSASKNCCLVWRGLPARLALAAGRLKNVHVHSRPAVELLSRFLDRPDAAIFIDPPYPRATLSNKWEASYRVEMSDAEHDALAAVLAAPGVRARVILTMARRTVYEAALNGGGVACARSACARPFVEAEAGAALPKFRSAGPDVVRGGDAMTGRPILPRCADVHCPRVGVHRVPANPLARPATAHVWYCDDHGDRYEHNVALGAIDLGARDFFAELISWNHAGETP